MLLSPSSLPARLRFFAAGVEGVVAGQLRVVRGEVVEALAIATQQLLINKIEQVIGNKL